MTTLDTAQPGLQYKVQSVPAAQAAPQPALLSIQNLNPTGHIVRGILIGGAIGLGIGIGVGVGIGGLLGGAIGGIITVLGAIGGAIGGILDWLSDLF